MRHNSEIKRRRQARIEQIKQMLVRSGKPADGSATRMSRLSEHGTSGGSSFSRDQSKDSWTAVHPPADPEEAWKRKMASWSGQPYRERRGSGDGDTRRRSAIWRLPAWGGLSLTSLLISFLLFILTWGLFQLQISWAERAQEVITGALQEPFRTEKAAAWYKERFGGSPSWIPIWQSDGGQAKVQAVHSETLLTLQAPVSGQIVTPFAANEQGIQIKLNPDEPIRAAAEGRVMFLGTTSMGTTIVIQHPNQIQTVYACLDETAVEVHDWVKQGDVLARGVEERQASGEDVLYFSIRAGDQYMDPAVVVRFD